MIVAHDIHKSFGALEVLKGIDIDVVHGAVTSIVGPSGAGKTTLLQIIGTLFRPDKGTVKYDNVDVFALSDKALSRFRNENIGFVFQMHRLLPEFSLEENVAIPALIAGTDRNKAFDEARRLLKFLGLESRATHRPAELSGGECQRGAVARALINKPQVILADEAFRKPRLAEPPRAAQAVLQPARRARSHIPHRHPRRKSRCRFRLHNKYGRRSNSFHNMQ